MKICEHTWEEAEEACLHRKVVERIKDPKSTTPYAIKGCYKVVEAKCKSPVVPRVLEEPAPFSMGTKRS